MPDTSVLEQLGVKLPPPPVGGMDTNQSTPEASATPLNTQPVVEATSPIAMAGVKDMIDTLLGGAVLVIEQAAVHYGLTTEDGKKLMKAIDYIMSVIPETKVKEAEAQLGGLIKGGAMGMLQTGLPTQQPAGVPPAGMPLPPV